VSFVKRALLPRFWRAALGFSHDSATRPFVAGDRTYSGPLKMHQDSGRIIRRDLDVVIGDHQQVVAANGSMLPRLDTLRLEPCSRSSTFSAGRSSGRRHARFLAAASRFRDAARRCSDNQPNPSRRKTGPVPNSTRQPAKGTCRKPPPRRHVPWVPCGNRASARRVVTEDSRTPVWAPRYRCAVWKLKKPSKTAAELEASIKVEMEDICDSPTDIVISVRPDGDSWVAVVVQESGDDPDRRQMIEQIAARLKAEYDLKI
jgi:hypothetical protein